ncbi:MAG TPA: Gldg family protein [Kofleriaceae bacterium]|nr:Gldg family protein [Kofleriaceae bacterium]
MRATYWVWRRELQVTLRAPIVYIIGGLFLIVQGVAFAGLVSVLSDPTKPAPLGALLEGQLAGTLLTWVLQLVVLTLLGMRAIAEDKKSGAWELLLTAQVGERAAVVGKWLAAVTVYALLWLPTLAYLGIVAVFRVDSGGWDLPSIVLGYLGAIALGAALLAWTVAASAATSNTLVAGGLGFFILIVFFLVGELPAAFPDVAIDHPTLGHVLGALSLRDELTNFARGELSVVGVLFVIGLAVSGLSFAIAFACAGRRTRREVGTRVLASVLVVVIGVLGGVLAGRRSIALDMSAARRNTLDPETRLVLAELPGRAKLTIVRPTLGALEPIYDEVERVADRMAAEGSVDVRSYDPATLPGGLDAAARAAGLAPGDLASNGGVVVEVGGRRRVVDRLQLVDIGLNPKGPMLLESLAIEQSIAGAMAELTRTAPVTVCATTGHGELPLARDAKEADWFLVVERLRGEGMTVAPVDIGAGVPEKCKVLVVPGPTTPLSGGEALAVQSFLQRGGGLVVAAASRPIVGAGAGGESATSTRLAATGLEGVLGTAGLGLPPAIAVDPSLTVREIPGALLVVDGYADHPVNAGFAQARATVWFQPRVVIASKGAQPLVRASSASWGERDLVTAPPEKNEDDVAGPAVLAALGAPATKGEASRVLVIGSAESFSTAVLKGGLSAADLWLAHAIRYVAGVPVPKVAIGARGVDQVRLVMTPAQRRIVTWLSITGIPLVWAVLGALVLVARRRKSS